MAGADGGWFSCMSDEMMLMTEATGKTGRRVVRLLEERGVAVRAASRSGTPSFDWTDRSTWGPALRGMTGMYLVHPDLGTPQAAEAVAAFARQAAAAGARHAVLPIHALRRLGPCPGARPGRGTSAGPLRLGVDRAAGSVVLPELQRGLPVRPVLSGEVWLPAGDGKEAFIDAEDIAEVAVAAEAGHAGWHYELSGPRLLSFREAVEEIARATGRDIRYVPLTPEAYAEEQRAQGVPEEWVQLSIGLYEQVPSGGLTTLGDGIQRALGRAPRDFSEYAESATAAGAWND